MLNIIFLGLWKMAYLWGPVAILMGGCAIYEEYKANKK